MLNIQDKSLCCCCTACEQACPKHCITMTGDEEGFLYPEVDKNTCIDCGLCEKVCNELHPFEERVPLKVLAAINKNEEVRMKSSSGGIFYLLAEKTISEGGVVFGARFDENWQVVIDYAEDLQGVKAFMGSKYVQARMENAYTDVMRFLREGRKVLFSGTPCQVAGLHKFLRKPYDNLLTVDFICHGTPSPMVWRKYLDEAICDCKRISNIQFRNKSKDWKNFCLHISYNRKEKAVSLLSPHASNPFMRAFLHDIILRPSCYTCKARSGRSHSDITLADFWGVSTVIPEMDDNKGTSLVFVHSEKGSEVLYSHQLITAETDYRHVRRLNPACFRSPGMHPKREEYFHRITQGENMAEVTADCTKPTFRQQLRYLCSRGKRYVALIIRGG